jgi:hypothetical protein
MQIHIGGIIRISIPLFKAWIIRDWGTRSRSSGLPLTHSKKDPMPFDTSDAVVVGTVTVGQSYLSNDRRDIYSEFKVKLGEIIQNSNTVYLRANDSIESKAKMGRFGSHLEKY